MTEERPFKEVTIPVPWGEIHGNEILSYLCVLLVTFTFE